MARAAVDRHHVRDLHATILHRMGLDHERHVRFHGRLGRNRTGVQTPRPIREILA